jgi:hypothetical protein
MAKSDIQMQSVSSSNLSAVGYDEETKTLRVLFRTGLTYEYSGVSPKVYDQLLAAESIGQYFHANIRSDFPYSKL